MGWLKATTLSLLALVAPVKAMVLAMLALVALDTVLGIMAARKRGERITSAGLRRTVSKMTAFLVAILAGHVAGVYLFANLIPVASLVAGAIGVVELTSVLENANGLAGKNVFQAVIDRLGSKNQTPHPGAEPRG